MKIQCACGTKVAFDVTPEMARTRVQFVCPNCGQDSSDLVNELIRKEFAAGPAAPPPVEIAHPPTAEAGAPPAPPARPRPIPVAVRPTATSASAPGPAVPRPVTPAVSTRTATNSGVRVGDSARAAGTSKFCAKHPGLRTTHECLVCHKPICPRCMQLFGYVCSPLCKEKAELQGIEVPVYQGQRDVVARGQWRHIRLVSTSIFLGVAAVLGAWFWWAWIATSPRPTFSVRFDRTAYSGECKLVPENQLIFLHGLTLARYDIKTKKDIWSFDIMTPEEITNVATLARDQMAVMRNKAVDRGEDAWNIPTSDEVVSMVSQGQAEELGLHIVGKNIWVSSFKKLARYDFDTGKVTQTVRFTEYDETRPFQKEFQIISPHPKLGTETVTHVDLATGETRDEVLPYEPDPDEDVDAEEEMRHHHQPGDLTDLTPDEIAARYSGMSMPERIALPATLSIAKNQEAALQEMRDDDQGPRHKKRKKISTINVDHFWTVLTMHGAVQISERLLNENFTEHVAMKDPPKKSIIDGNLTAGNSEEASSEILNQMKRDNGGGTAVEDDSSYQIIIRRIDNKDATDWRADTIGPPIYFPLQTVDVVAANKSITVLDKSNKELWKADLTYNIGGGGENGVGDEQDHGPCVEHDNTLYVYDQGMLTAFDVATGNVHWRVPSVGIYDLTFNKDGMLYVSTTTAGPESIKYSNQIDLADQTADVLMKIDPKDGKILWNVQPGGHVAYISDKYIYTLEAYRPYEDDQHPFERGTGLERSPYTTVKRIDPKNGKTLWELDEPRGPLDVKFDNNLIEIVFKKEVEVLKYLTL